MAWAILTSKTLSRTAHLNDYYIRTVCISDYHGRLMAQNQVSSVASRNLLCIECCRPFSNRQNLRRHLRQMAEQDPGHFTLAQEEGVLTSSHGLVSQREDQGPSDHQQRKAKRVAEEMIQFPGPFTPNNLMKVVVDHWPKLTWDQSTVVAAATFQGILAGIKARPNVDDFLKRASGEPIHAEYSAPPPIHGESSTSEGLGTIPKSGTPSDVEPTRDVAPSKLKYCPVPIPLEPLPQDLNLIEITDDEEYFPIQTQKPKDDKPNDKLVADTPDGPRHQPRQAMKMYSGRSLFDSFKQVLERVQPKKPEHHEDGTEANACAPATELNRSTDEIKMSAAEIEKTTQTNVAVMSNDDPEPINAAVSEEIVENKDQTPREMMTSPEMKVLIAPEEKKAKTTRKKTDKTSKETISSHSKSKKREGHSEVKQKKEEPEVSVAQAGGGTEPVFPGPGWGMPPWAWFWPPPGFVPGGPWGSPANVRGPPPEMVARFWGCNNPWNPTRFPDPDQSN